jgi:hypothetical protein
MHAGIGPARPHDAQFLSQKGGQGFFKHFLHGNGIGLVLPSVVCFPEIGKLDKISQRDPLLLSC